MASKDYRDTLKDPRWQRRRLEILDRDGFACTNCGDTETTLHVDHKYYTWGKKPWEYDDDALQTLCEPCHTKEGLLRKALKEVLRAADHDKGQIRGYAQGLVALRDGSSIAIETYEQADGIAAAIGGGLIADDVLEYCGGGGFSVRPVEMIVDMARGLWKQSRESAALAAGAHAALTRRWDSKTKLKAKR